MAAANWTITIRPGTGPNAPAQFDPPDLPVRAQDIISWSNTTRDIHELSWRDVSGNWFPLPIGGPIYPDDQSDAVTVDRSFEYRCDRHPSETGSVTVKP
jgi:hypothetical protein